MGTFPKSFQILFVGVHTFSCFMRHFAPTPSFPVMHIQQRFSAYIRNFVYKTVYGTFSLFK